MLPEAERLICSLRSSVTGSNAVAKTNNFISTDTRFDY